MTESIKTKTQATRNPVSACKLQRKNTAALARWLIGKTLARRMPGGTVCRAIITETEAYHGETDLACHAEKGRTPRTEVMYRPGGIWYVYLCYGMHEMLNLVTGPADYPAAILIRGIENHKGPGRLTRALQIDRRHNALPITRATQLWLEDDGLIINKTEIRATPRIGIDYATHPWRTKPWRFVWAPR